MHFEGENAVSRRDAAQVLAMCAWVKKQVGKIEEKAKAEADVTFPEEKTAGVVDGTVVSYTSRVSRKPELKILDDGAFVAWVAEYYPTEIMPAIRPAFLAELKERAIEVGAVISSDGEVCEAVELDEPIVYTTTRLTKDADATLQPLLSMPLVDLPAYIEGATDLDGAA